MRALITKTAGEPAVGATGLAAKAVDETTAVDLNTVWVRDDYELLLPTGLALTVGTSCIPLMFAARRRAERALAPATIGTMTGVLFSFTPVAITVVDALRDGLFQAANSSADDAIRRVSKVNKLGRCPASAGQSQPWSPSQFSPAAPGGRLRSTGGWAGSRPRPPSS